MILNLAIEKSKVESSSQRFSLLFFFDYLIYLHISTLDVTIKCHSKCILTREIDI